MRRFILSLALVAGIAGASVPAFAQQSTSTMPTCSAGDPVVWVNTNTKKYHMQGDSYYGKTKQGKYACKSAADAQGDKQAKMSSSKSSGAAPGTNMNTGTMPAMKSGAAPGTNMNTATQAPMSSGAAPGTNMNPQTAPSPVPSGMATSKHHRRHGKSKASPSPDMVPSAAPTE